MSDFGTCPRCQRILALVGGRLPRHRAPIHRRYQSANPNYSVPLTGLDAPWCTTESGAAPEGGAKRASLRPTAQAARYE